VAAWQAEGSPRFNAVSLGSFESWAGVVGGILDVAGIPGFLGNLEELYRDTDSEGQEWREFVAAWWGAFQDRPVTPLQLYSVCASRDLMESVRGEGRQQSQVTRLGMALKKAHDRVFGRYRICVAADGGPHKGRAYALAVVEAPLRGGRSKEGD